MSGWLRKALGINIFSCECVFLLHANRKSTPVSLMILFKAVQTLLSFEISNRNTRAGIATHGLEFSSAWQNSLRRCHQTPGRRGLYCCCICFSPFTNHLTIACFTYFGPTTHLDFARLKRLNYLSPLLPV